MNRHVFISYRSSNKSQAFELCEFLEQRGVRCWIAPRDVHPGSNYAGEITRAVKSSSAMVVVISKSTEKSDHVRNEVGLAVSNALPIIPYRLDDKPLDDDLTYYLSSKHMIFSTGDSLRDFEAILDVIPESQDRVQFDPQFFAPKRHPWKIWSVAAAVLAAIALCVFFSVWPALEEETPVEEPVEDTTAVEQIEPALPQESAIQDNQKKAAVMQENSVYEPVTARPGQDVFSGTIIDGYPDGIGTYIFKKERRIDTHDSENRIAKIGDYIEGEWDKGHLIQGKWYSVDGVSKGIILIGKAGNPEADHCFEKCGN